MLPEKKLQQKLMAGSKLNKLINHPLSPPPY